MPELPQVSWARDRQLSAAQHRPLQASSKTAEERGLQNEGQFKKCCGIQRMLHLFLLLAVYYCLLMIPYITIINLVETLE